MTIQAYAWLAVAVVMVIVEGVTFSLVSVWFAGGAVAAFFAALLKGSFPVQLLLFVAVSAILLAGLRPLARRHVKSRKQPTNADRVIGRVGIVTEAIDNIQATGAVKVDGVEWIARSEYDAVIEPGARVTVLRISGVKVFVEPAVVPART